MPVKHTNHFEQVSNRYLNYVLVMLTMIYVFNFADRQILVILQESIKKEFELSDTDLGLLSGFIFAIFYVMLGIPIARYADRRNRRNIVAGSLGLWSVMTAISGYAGNFIQLLLARIGVGVGQAGESPSAHAMISDYFPPEKRATALSIYSTGIYIGILIGFLMGGYLNQHYGWRTAFFVVGIPGIIFSLLFYITVKEPKKGATDVRTMASGETHSLRSALKLLYSNKSFHIPGPGHRPAYILHLCLIELGSLIHVETSWNENCGYRCFTRFDLWARRGNRNLCPQITDRSSWKKR